MGGSPLSVERHIKRRDSLLIVDKVALPSLCRDTLSPILCEGEIVCLYIYTKRKATFSIQ